VTPGVVYTNSTPGQCVTAWQWHWHCRFFTVSSEGQRSPKAKMGPS